MEFTAFQSALAVKSISDLDIELTKLGFTQSLVSYSAIIWRGEWEGLRITFVAYPSADRRRTVQSYCKNLCSRDSALKLFDNFFLNTSQEEENRLLAC